MGTTEEPKVLSVNVQLINELYDDETDGRTFDFQKCFICINQFSEAFKLDCKHTFCTPCLKGFMNYEFKGVPEGEWESRNLVCPTCRSASKETLNDLENALQSATIEVCSDKSKGSSNGSDNVLEHRESNASSNFGVLNCDSCQFNSQIEEAEVYCSKCSLNMCAQCQNKHSNHLLFKNHTVIHISNYNSVTIFCKKHLRQQCGYFCQDCNVPCCAVCILHGHLKDSTTTFMEAMTQKKEKVKSVLNNLGPQIDKLESRLKRIRNYEDLVNRGNFAVSFTGQEGTNNFTDCVDAYKENDAPFDMRGSAKKLTLPLTDVTNPTPKRKRRFSFFDNDKKRQNEGAASRKISIFDTRKGKKMSLPVVSVDKKDIHVKRQTSALEVAGNRVSRTPSPLASPIDEEKPLVSEYIDLDSIDGVSQTQSLLERNSISSGSGKRTLSVSSASSTQSWHPFVRMTKTSPILRRKSKSTSLATQCSTTEKKENNRLPSPLYQPQQQYLLHPEPNFTSAPVDIDRNQVECFENKVRYFRKLYDFAAKSLLMAHSKKILEFYDIIVMRVRSAADNEVQKVKREVREIHNEVEQALAQLTPAHSNGSVDLLSGDSRKASGGSSEDNVSMQDKDGDLSLLIKPVHSWSTEKHKSDKDAEVWNQCGVCFLPSGSIAVAEYDMVNKSHNRLQIYNNAGTLIKVICQEQICPLGVAVTPDGFIAVTDSKSKRVKIITEAGDIVSEWGKGQFGWPHGIAVNSRGHVIVSDAFNDVISIHQVDGRRIKQFGASGTGVEQFRNPYHLTVDQHDNIIVSDCGNNCIKVFNSNGEFLFTNRGVSASSIEGIHDKKTRHLKAPRGVVVDPKGNILVADDNNRICMFDSRGKYVRNILTEEEEGVKYVEGLSINKRGELVITECNPANMVAVKKYILYKKDTDAPETVQSEGFKLRNLRAGP